MDRRELLAQFTAARKMGWRVDSADFPEVLAEPFFPRRYHLFRALEQRGPADVNYCIIGQDPYASDDANGIAFSVERASLEKGLPPSLVRIMAEIHPRGQGEASLQDWIAEKKILLLNAALTVPVPRNGPNAPSVAGMHLSLWHKFAKSVVVQLIRERPEVKLVAWGAAARELICVALEHSGAFTSCPHPSRPTTRFKLFWESPVGQSLRMRRPAPNDSGVKDEL